MLTTRPPSSTPCLSLAPVLHVCWLKGIFWSLQEKRVALHAHCLPLAPVQSKVLLARPGPGPVSACAPQTRLNNLLPPCSSFHILTSQTGKVFWGGEAGPVSSSRLLLVPPVIWTIFTIACSLSRESKMFLMRLQPVFFFFFISTFQKSNVIKLFSTFLLRLFFIFPRQLFSFMEILLFEPPQFIILLSFSSPLFTTYRIVFLI